MLSKAQIDSRLLHFEDCAEAVDEMFRSALKANGAGAFDELREFVRKFNNLSVYNAMLVRTQRPGAAAVGSRKQWLKIGRRVKPGAIPIVTLKPFGPVSFVYEQADTEGQELLPGFDGNPFHASGQFDDKTLEHTIKAVRKYNIEVEISDKYGEWRAGSAAGLHKTSNASGEQTFHIKLNGKHSRIVQYTTLAHELGHVFCGHLGGDSKGRWPDRSNIPARVRELEAEAVSWLVCQRKNIKTNADEYLTGSISRLDLRFVSMYIIFDAANRVEIRG